MTLPKKAAQLAISSIVSGILPGRLLDPGDEWRSVCMTAQIELHALLVFAVRSFENSGFFRKECSLAGTRGGRGKGVSSQQMAD
jgi:hypothetical protein